MAVASILLIIASITSSDTRAVETCDVHEQACNGRDSMLANVASSEVQAESADDAFASNMQFHLLQSSLRAKQNDDGAVENEALDQKPRRVPVKMHLVKKAQEEEEEEDEETKAPKLQTAQDLRKQISSAVKTKMDSLRAKLKKDATELKQKLLAKRAPFKVQRDLKKTKDKNKLKHSPTYQALSEASEKIAEHAAMERAKQVAKERRTRSALENLPKDSLKPVKDAGISVTVQKDAKAGDVHTAVTADIAHETKVAAKATAVSPTVKLSASDQSAQPKEKLQAHVKSDHDTQPTEKLPSLVKSDPNTVSSQKAVAIDHDVVPAKPVHAMDNAKPEQTAVPAKQTKKATHAEHDQELIAEVDETGRVSEIMQADQINVPSKPVVAKAAQPATAPETPLNRPNGKAVELEEAHRKELAGVQDTSLDAGDYFEKGFNMSDLLENNVHFDDRVDHGELEEALASVPSKVVDQGELDEALASVPSEGVDQGELEEALASMPSQGVDQGEMNEALASVPSKGIDQGELEEALASVPSKVVDQGELDEALASVPSEGVDQGELEEALATVPSQEGVDQGELEEALATVPSEEGVDQGELEEALATVPSEEGVDQGELDEALASVPSEGVDQGEMEEALATVTSEEGVDQGELEEAVATVPSEEGVDQGELEETLATVPSEEGVDQGELDEALASVPSEGVDQGELEEALATVTSEEGVDQGELEEAVATVPSEEGVDQGELEEAFAKVTSEGVDQGELEEAFAKVTSEGVDQGELQELGLDRRVDQGEMQELASASSKDEIDLGEMKEMEAGSPLGLAQEEADKHPFIGKKVIVAQEDAKKLAEKFIGKGLNGLNKLSKKISVDWMKKANKAKEEGKPKPATPLYAKQRFNIIDKDLNGKISPEELNAELSKYNSGEHPVTTTTVAPYVMEQLREKKKDIAQHAKNEAVASVYKAKFKANITKTKVKSDLAHSGDKMSGIKYKAESDATKKKAKRADKLQEVRNKHEGSRFQDKTEAAKNILAAKEHKKATAGKRLSIKTRKETIAEEKQQKVQDKLEAANGKGYKARTDVKIKTESAQQKTEKSHTDAKSTFYGKQDKIKSEGSEDKDAVDEAVNAREGQLDGAVFKTKKEGNKRQEEVQDNLAAEKSRYTFKMEPAKKEAAADKKKTAESIGVEKVKAASAYDQTKSDTEGKGQQYDEDVSVANTKMTQKRENVEQDVKQTAEEREAHTDKHVNKLKGKDFKLRKDMSDTRADHAVTIMKESAKKKVVMDSAKEESRNDAERTDEAKASHKAHLDKKAQQAKDQTAESAEKAEKRRASEKAHLDKANSDTRADVAQAADETAGKHKARASQMKRPSVDEVHIYYNKKGAQVPAKVKQDSAAAAIAKAKADLDRQAAQAKEKVANSAAGTANARSAAKSKIDKADSDIAQKAGSAAAGSDANKAAAGSKAANAAGDIKTKAGQSVAGHDNAIAEGKANIPTSLPPYQPEKDTLKGTTITGHHGAHLPSALTIKDKVLEDKENLRLAAAARHEGLMQKLQDRKLHLDRVNPKIAGERVLAASKQMKQMHTDAIRKMLVDAPKAIASKIMHRPLSLLEAGSAELSKSDTSPTQEANPHYSNNMELLKQQEEARKAAKAARMQQAMARGGMPAMPDAGMAGAAMQMSGQRVQGKIGGTEAWRTQVLPDGKVKRADPELRRQERQQMLADAAAAREAIWQQRLQKNADFQKTSITKHVELRARQLEHRRDIEEFLLSKRKYIPFEERANWAEAADLAETKRTPAAAKDKNAASQKVGKVDKDAKVSKKEVGKVNTAAIVPNPKTEEVNSALAKTKTPAAPAAPAAQVKVATAAASAAAIKAKTPAVPAAQAMPAAAAAQAKTNTPVAKVTQDTAAGEEEADEIQEEVPDRNTKAKRKRAAALHQKEQEKLALKAAVNHAKAAAKHRNAA